MKYIVTYKGTTEEKLSTALVDVLLYLGRDKLCIVKDYINLYDNVRSKIFAIRYCCMLTGIEGYYPIHAITLYLLKE